MWNYHHASVSSFIGLAYEGISSFLHHKHNKALHKAVKGMDDNATIQCKTNSCNWKILC